MIAELKKRTVSYFKVVVKNLRDVIPKNIKFLLFIEASKKLEFEIFQSCVGQK
jgi:hypothetical protein